MTPANSLNWRTLEAARIRELEAQGKRVWNPSWMCEHQPRTHTGSGVPITNRQRVFVLRRAW